MSMSLMSAVVTPAAVSVGASAPAGVLSSPRSRVTPKVDARDRFMVSRETTVIGGGPLARVYGKPKFDFSIPAIALFSLGKASRKLENRYGIPDERASEKSAMA